MMRIKTSGLALLLGAVAFGGCDAGSMTASELAESGQEPLATASQGLTADYGGHTYFLSATARTWGDAAKDCADRRMGLVTINDAAEDQWIRAQMMPIAGEWWLGLNDREKEGTWTWLDGESSYANWNPGEPNAATSAEDCAVTTHGTGWNDIPCTLTKTYACESVPPKEASREGHGYLFYSTRLPWTEARKVCLAQGFDLVTVDDALEDTWLKQQVPTGRTAWIGFNDRAKEGTWSWSDGSQVGYQNWRRYEPNNSGGNEHCAVNNAPATSSATGGGWNDIPCTEYVSYVCERAPLPADYKAVVYSAVETASATVNTKDVEVWLDAGQTLRLGTCGMPGATAVEDTLLRLLGPDGLEVATNDDDCKGSGSRLQYRVPACGAGIYVIRAGCYEATSCAGQVSFTVIPAPQPQP